MNKKSVLITDLDNTLFDWFNVWYHSFNAMLTEVVNITNLPKDLLIKQIRPIHQKFGTAEYSFVLEQIPALQELYGDRVSINEALDPAIHAYRSERKKYLKLYPTVMDTLKILKRKNILVIGYTESKEFYSNYRISKLNLDGVIDILFSPEDHDVPDGVIKSDKYELIYTRNRHTPYGEIKPNPTILKNIVKQLNVSIDECVYIGDSEMKDIYMAQEIKMSNVFAKYGIGHFQDNKDGYELLRAVTHWSDEDVRREKEINEKKSSIMIKPDFIANQFSDILSFFDFEGNQK
ncbi:HAD family hydrolase [Providencia alcalifaciens]|uniref:phosphoglycolate phosphatase n=1 Tax=Providencia alcalifaciens 205/92 TaxID=1256988 RepID=A0AAV3M0H8_9GAMM|nr:HAD-IA family hydrolase [Providencia alcalifaciens]EUD09295.1 haloacid dehalogenase-like hydrolase [Providencia alcalifaciens 205/92]WGZ54411.1 HAD-IA family hydrolase [Providencia alcalifaciens]